MTRQTGPPRGDGHLTGAAEPRAMKGYMMDYSNAVKAERPEGPELELVSKQFSGVIDQISCATERLDALGDRLFGSQPSMVRDDVSDNRLGPSGLLSQIRGQLGEADKRGNRLFAAIERLERL